MSTIRDQIKTTFMGLAGLLSKMNVMQGSNPSASNTAILDAVGNIDIDTSDLAKQGSDTGATNTAIMNAILDNAGTPTLSIPDTTSSQELAPNTLYIFTTRSSDLTLTLGTPIIGIANEYHLFLTIDSSADPVPTINWPSGISWNGGNAPTITAGNTYEVSILNNIAMFIEIEPQAQS